MTPEPALTDARPLAVVDIDGVVADVRHRLHFLQGRRKEWDRFFEAADDDPPHREGIDFVNRLAADHDVVFLTGRPSRLEQATERWLTQQGLGGHRLIMRPNGDRRPAALVKLELLGELAKGRHVGVVVDDDPIVVAAMERSGYPTHHAQWEQRAIDDERALLQAQERDGRT